MPLYNVNNERFDKDGNPEEKETDWPETDIIVVSPPFLGDKKLLGELGETYTSDFRKG